MKKYGNQMSLKNAQSKSSELYVCVLLGEEGGKTRDDKVEDKEMDETGQQTEGEWSEITLMKTSRDGESSGSAKTDTVGQMGRVQQHKSIRVYHEGSEDERMAKPAQC